MCQWGWICTFSFPRWPHVVQNTVQSVQFCFLPAERKLQLFFLFSLLASMLHILQLRCFVSFSLFSVLSVSAKSLPCISWRSLCNSGALFLSLHFHKTIECFCLFVQLMQVVVFNYQLITNCRLNSDELALLFIFKSQVLCKSGHVSENHHWIAISSENHCCPYWHDSDILTFLVDASVEERKTGKKV